ncbi:Cytochrome P450 monooxygenase apf7 [Lachnellula suecica]|uniref:Cytochrome P450 monooxygenase apf7 n=1 Tax=Lachnellula suecica TaxID=602035 RepID=A0A8T9CBI3_9HELO|nr:Cytochrome P450 monooxygenase apf7 [Lachnellula suecica]
MDFQAVFYGLLRHCLLLGSTFTILYSSTTFISALSQIFQVPSLPESPRCRHFIIPQQVIATYGHGNATKSTAGPDPEVRIQPATNFWVGKVCRIQPNVVIFNSPSAYRSIYGPTANARKADIYKVWRQDMNKISTLTAVEKAEHGRKKKLLKSAFTDDAIRSAEAFVVQHVDSFCNILVANSEAQQTTNMADMADRLVFDIMCDLSFGKSFELKESASNPLLSVPHSIDTGAVFLSNIGRSPFLPVWLWLKTKGLNTILNKTRPAEFRLLFSLIRTNILRRIEEESQVDEKRNNGRKDMFHYLFHTQDSVTGVRAYSDAELTIEAGLLLTTALGATATSVSAFLFYITRNQHAYKKLIEEIRNTFASADEIQGSAVLSSCRYLRACLDETLRMTPAQPGEGLRIVLKGGLEIEGHFTSEGVSSFGDPWVFRPERWIVDERNGVYATDVARAQSAFFPFSIGPVSCVGQKLARSIISVTVAKMLYQFDVVLPPGNRLGEGAENLGWGRRDNNVFQVRDATFALREGPMVQFMKRQAV